MSTKKKNNPLQDYITSFSKMKNGKLYVVIDGKASRPKEDQIQSIKYLHEALALIEKARSNGITIKEDKVYYTSSDQKEYLIAERKMSTEESKVKIAVVSSEDIKPKKKYLTTPKPIIKDISVDEVKPKVKKIITPKRVAKESSPNEVKPKSKEKKVVATPKRLVKESSPDEVKPKSKEKKVRAKESSPESVKPKSKEKKVVATPKRLVKENSPESVKPKDKGKKVRAKESSPESVKPKSKEKKVVATPKRLVKESSPDEVKPKDKGKKVIAKESSPESVKPKDKGKKGSPTSVSSPVLNKVKSVPLRVILPNIETASRRSILFDRLCEAYEYRYQPPGALGVKNEREPEEEFARRAYIDNITYNMYAPYARVYAPASADRDIVSRLVTEREPTNLAANKFFNTANLEKYFGYDTSFYQRYYDETGELAPNIGIYTKAPLKMKDKTIVDVHMYHAVAYALNSKKQPDYKVLASKKKSLLKLYECIFIRIFQCAKQHIMTRVILPIIGGDSFADLYPGGSSKFREEIFIPALTKIMKPHWKDIRIDFMGDKNDLAIKHFAKLGHYDVGYYPEFVYDSTFVAESTLIVNSVDPHSIVGLNDKLDNNSKVGKYTGVQFFGTGLTNPYLRSNITLVKC